MVRKCFCNKSQPNFNYPNETKALYCSSCKLEGMVNIYNKKCICKKSTPHFNYPNETKALYCGSCKLDGMVYVISKYVFVINQDQVSIIRMKQNDYIAVLVN